jgi:hypothetical protein
MRAVVTLVVLNCLLLVPIWIGAGRIGPQWIALEAVLIAAGLILLPGRLWARASGVVVGLLVVAVAVLALGDTAARMSLARPLNLYLDLRLVPSIGHLVEGAVGMPSAVAALLALASVGVLLVGVAALLARLPGTVDGRPLLRRALLAALALAAIAVPARWAHPSGVVLGTTGVDLIRDQTAHWRRMVREKEDFAAALASPVPVATAAGPPLAGLDGRDVVLAFIESYGVSSLDDPRYAPVVVPRIEALGSVLEDRGLHVASGRLVAPSQGGMSWLGHGSILSGLWLENQLRYDLLLASGRTTLVDDFEAAGYRTAALMPAITLAWPEGERFGYEQIFAHADIDYAGPPLNWVTMPDQFTWSFLENRIRRSDDPRPLFAELGLISSHAPWTPILEVLDDWEAIGDGAVFQRWAGAGEAPESLWKDVERVREHYARSVAYAVDAMAGWASRYVDDRVVLIALGDHQPAPLITGDDADRSVPVHVIAADPALIAPFLEWGFTAGALPPPEAAPRRMDAFRSWFLQAFSEAPPVAASRRASAASSGTPTAVGAAADGGASTPRRRP